MQPALGTLVSPQVRRWILGTNMITAGLVTTSGASPAITGTGTINASRGFYFKNTGDITVDAVLAGGGPSKTQTNGLTLTGLNTYTGTTEVQNGTVSFDSIANVGAGASALGLLRRWRTASSEWA